MWISHVEAFFKMEKPVGPPEAPDGFFGYCEAEPFLLIRLPNIMDLGPPRTSVPTVKRENRRMMRFVPHKYSVCFLICRDRRPRRSENKIRLAHQSTFEAQPPHTIKPIGSLRRSDGFLPYKKIITFGYRPCVLCNVKELHLCEVLWLHPSLP